MLTHSETPLNAEPKLSVVAQSNITPAPLVFHRNHGEPPAEAKQALESSDGLDGWTIELEVEEGLGGLPKSKTHVKLGDIRQSFAERSETIALQCAGNRRTLFAHGASETEGIPWEEGTIANLSWTGYLLKDVLDRYLLEDAKVPSGSHVVFESCQDCGEDEGGIYGGSIQSEVVWADDAPVMLGLKLDGEALDLQHGGPVRMVVPGHIGARSIKWLKKIKISSKAAPHHAQQQDYKVVHTSNTDPTADEKKRMMERTEPMGWSSLQCVVAEAKQEDGQVRVRGYAQGEKGTPIRSISVAVMPQPEGVASPDELFAKEQSLTEQAEREGQWHTVQASREMVKDGKNWGWTLWEAKLPLPAESDRKWVVVAKAADDIGREQERWPEWNLRGVGFDGWSVRPVRS